MEWNAQKMIDVTAASHFDLPPLKRLHDEFLALKKKEAAGIPLTEEDSLNKKDADEVIGKIVSGLDSYGAVGLLAVILPCLIASVERGQKETVSI